MKGGIQIATSSILRSEVIEIKTPEETAKFVKALEKAELISKSGGKLMKLPRYKCNWCGREYDDDGCLHNPFNITHKFGYESKEYDNAILDIDLCPTCADGLTNYIISKSQVDSVTRADYDWSEC